MGRYKVHINTSIEKAQHTSRGARWCYFRPFNAMLSVRRLYFVDLFI